MTNTDSHSRPLLPRWLGIVAMLSVHLFALFVVILELVSLVPMHILLLVYINIGLALPIDSLSNAYPMDSP